MIVHRTDDGVISGAEWNETHIISAGVLADVSGAVTLNPADGAVQRATLVGAVTLSLPLVTSGETQSITLILTNGAGFGSVTVSGVKWIGGAAPEFGDELGDVNVLTLLGTSGGWIADGGSAE